MLQCRRMSGENWVGVKVRNEPRLDTLSRSFAKAFRREFFAYVTGVPDLKITIPTCLESIPPGPPES